MKLESYKALGINAGADELLAVSSRFKDSSFTLDDVAIFEYQVKTARLPKEHFEEKLRNFGYKTLEEYHTAKTANEEKNKRVYKDYIFKIQIIFKPELAYILAAISRALAFDMARNA